MTRNDTSYRTKGRAVFLAAIMVLSMVGMSVAFAGGAAAVEPRDVSEFDEVEGELVYEGQVFDVTDDDIGPDSIQIDTNNEDTMYLVEVTDTEDGEVESASTVGSAISVENNAFELDLDGIEAGQYAVSNSSGNSGAFSLPFDVQVQDVDADWDDDVVTEDDDEAEIEVDLGRNDNAANYNLTVWAEGPDDFDDEMIEELLETSNVDENTFNGTVSEQEFLPLRTLEDDYDIDVDPDNRTDPDNIDELSDEGIVTFELNASELGRTDTLDLIADFNNLDDEVGLPDAGDYEFTFLVTDTGAADTDSVEIRESDTDGDFSAGVYQTTAGDISEFEFELEDTDETWIQIGDANSDFVDVLYIEADDADEPVEVTFNTRLLGTSTSLDGDGDVYDVENADTVESAYHDGSVTAPEGGLGVFADDDAPIADFDAYVDELGIADSASEQLTRPLQATDYELQLAGDDIDSDEGVFDADSGAGEAVDQLDSSVLELTQPDIGDITVHTAPEENADDADEISELVEAATVRDEIALEDRLVVQVEATGMYGGLVAGAEDENAADVDFDRLEDGVDSEVLFNFIDSTNESVDFEIVADEGAGNQDPNEVDFEDADDSDVYILIDNDEGQFFVVVDTSSDDAFDRDAPEDSESFTATLTYDADNDDERYEFLGSSNPDPFSAEDDAENYPYLSVGNTLSSSAEFDLEPREISFDNLNADDEVQAENIEDSEISGTTNVAPGSDAELRVSSTDASSSFRVGQDVDINEDGEITAEYDFSGQEVGDEFDTRFRASGSTVDTVDSVIVAEGDLGVEEPVEDDEADDEDDVVEDDDDEVVDDDDEVVDDDDDVEEPTDDETPGFGALVALVALIGAALLAVRRQNN